jgi:hypothetical protein
MVGEIYFMEVNDDTFMTTTSLLRLAGAVSRETS